MSGTITGHVHHTVVLGSHKFADTLTVTGTGDIRIFTAGANGVYLGAASGQGSLTNQGTITAGAGAYGMAQGGAGGNGVDFAAAGQVTNSGTITGGAGGSTGTMGLGGAGGAGILLSAGGSVSNSGTVTGGQGGEVAYPAYGTVGAGGIGVDLSAGGTLTNDGVVRGCTVGLRGYSLAGTGAAGVAALDATLVNTGKIYGGNGSGAGVSLSGGHATNVGTIAGGEGFGPNYQGGNGVNLLDGAALLNTGAIVGSKGEYVVYGYRGSTYGGGIGIYLGGASTLTNTGTITGGFGQSLANGAGTGVELTGASSLSNAGTIIGGTYAPGVDISGASHASNSGTVAGGGDGAGALVQSGSLLNTGTILGGAGSAANYDGNYYHQASQGGTGIVIQAESTVTDRGLIQGGAGGSNYIFAYVARGGVGVSVVGGTLSVASDGVVTGGRGGSAVYYQYAGGVGGTGVSITNSGTLSLDHSAKVFNAGLIAGGQGGQSEDAAGGNGGVGAYIDGGKLTTSGTISGGAGGVGLTGNGAMGAAVQFGMLGGTLVVDPGAVFNGAVLATGAAQSTLELAGTSPGTLSGFGTSITGLTTISEDAHANWVLGGDISGGTIELGASASLTLNGAISTTRITFSAAGGDTLRLASPGDVTSSFAGFGHGDIIDVAGVTANASSYARGVLTLYEDHVRTDTLAISATGSAGFGLASDGHGGTEIVSADSPFASSASIVSLPSPSAAGQILHGLISHTLL